MNSTNITNLSTSNLTETELKEGKQLHLLTFQQVFELWLSSLQVPVQKHMTKKLQMEINNFILPKFGHLCINEITIADYTKFLHTMNLKPSQLRLIKILVENVFNFAYMPNLIDTKPINTGELPYLSKAKYCTLSEAEILLNAFKTEGNLMHYTFFFLLVHTDIRKSEALALTWDDFDIENAELNISKYIRSYANNKEVMYSRTGSRNISLDENTFNVLLNWRMIELKELLAKNAGSDIGKQFIFQNKHNQQFFTPLRATNWLCKIQKNYAVPQHIKFHHLRRISTSK